MQPNKFSLIPWKEPGKAFSLHRVKRPGEILHPVGLYSAPPVLMSSFEVFVMVTVVAIETEQQIFGGQQHLSPRSPVKNVWEQAPAHQAAVVAVE